MTGEGDHGTRPRGVRWQDVDTAVSRREAARRGSIEDSHQRVRLGRLHRKEAIHSSVCGAPLALQTLGWPQTLGS